MVEYRMIPTHQHRRARQLLKDVIPSVIASDFVRGSNDARIQEFKSVYRVHRQEPPAIHEVYLGAYDGKDLVGVLHGLSFLYQFSFSPEMKRIGVYPLAEVSRTLGSYRRLAENGLFIEEVGVRPEFQGKGIGKGLFEALHQQFLEPAGLSQVVLASTDTNSHQFFEHLGFEDFGTLLPARYFGGIRDVPMYAEYASYCRWFACDYSK